MKSNIERKSNCRFFENSDSKIKHRSAISVRQAKFKSQKELSGAILSLEFPCSCSNNPECYLCHGDGKLVRTNPFIKMVEKIIEHKLGLVESLGTTTESRLVFEQVEMCKSVSSSTDVHEDYACNECAMEPIKGTRYHCNQCVDYDACQNCFKLLGHAHHMHPIDSDTSRQGMCSITPSRQRNRELLLNLSKTERQRYSQ